MLLQIKQLLETSMNDDYVNKVCKSTDKKIKDECGPGDCRQYTASG